MGRLMQVALPADFIGHLDCLKGLSDDPAMKPMFDSYWSDAEAMIRDNEHLRVRAAMRDELDKVIAMRNVMQSL